MISFFEELFCNADPAATFTVANGFSAKIHSNSYPCIVNYYGKNDEDLTKNEEDLTKNEEDLTKNEEVLTKNEEDLTKNIEYFDKFLAPTKLPIIYRVPYTYKSLDLALKSTHHTENKKYIVKIKNIDAMRRELFSFADFTSNGVHIEKTLQTFWLKAYSEFKQMKTEDSTIFMQNMNTAYNTFVYFTLMIEDEPFGLAYIMLERAHVVIIDIVINEKRRGNSYGYRLLMSILTYALREGAERALAQIHENNKSAIRLFDKIGFEDGYYFLNRMKEQYDNE